MSQANLDMVRSTHERFLATGEVDEDDVHPELEVFDHDILDAGTYRGIEGLGRWMRDWDAAWDGWSIEPERWLDAGERIVLIFHITAKGRGSGVEVSRRDALVWTVGEGRIVRIDYYNDPAQALEHLVRGAYDAFNRGDLEACLATIHPDLEWWPATDEPITEPYRGHEGYRKLWNEVREVSPDIQCEIEELSVNGDTVVSCLRFWGHGRESGAPVEIRETHVARLQDGKTIELREYRTKAEALEAAGLRG